MSMIEQYFEDNYTSGNAFDKAVEFHNDQQWYPVLYAGTKEGYGYNHDLFYITRGAADCEFDLYVIDWLKAFDYDIEKQADNDGWLEYIQVDSLQEAAEKLGLL